MLSRKSFNAIAAACVMSLGFSSATAQTVANGPYYATPSWDQTLPVATRFIVLSLMATQTPPPMATSNSPTLTVLR